MNGPITFDDRLAVHMGLLGSGKSGRLRGGVRWLVIVATALARSCGVEGIERGDKGRRGVATAGRAGATALVEGGVAATCLWGVVGGKGNVGLGGAARKDVEGRVDRDFKMSSFARILGVGLG